MKSFKQIREEMTPRLRKAIKTHSKPSNYDAAKDTGQYGTPKKDQAAARKAVAKSKKIIKRDAGQATYDRVKKGAEKGFHRRNYS